MPDNETPLGWLTYPDAGDRNWYDEDSSGQGLQQWLAQVELLGVPTYPTFADLPGAGVPASDGDQRQFAAVASDRTVYRTDGTEWVPWFGAGTADRPLPEQHVESLETGETHSGSYEDKDGKTYAGLPFYVYEDWGDSQVTSDRANQATGMWFGNGTEPLDARYRPEWTDERSGNLDPSGNTLTMTDSSEISVPTTVTHGTWRIVFSFDTPPSTSYFVCRATRQDADNQVLIQILGNGDLKLSKDENGTRTDMVSTTWTPDTEAHSIEAQRSHDNIWRLTFDGTVVGTAKDSFAPSGRLYLRQALDQPITIEEVEVAR